MPEQQVKTVSELAPLRRIVTGHDADGTAKVLLAGAPTNRMFSPTGAVSTLIWSTDECPADIATGEHVEDYGARVLGTAPPSHGTRFAIIDFPPRSTGSVQAGIRATPCTNPRARSMGGNAKRVRQAPIASRRRRSSRPAQKARANPRPAAKKPAPAAYKRVFSPI